ncbi:MAG: TatD family hydrolase [Myxococcaceae bacterium]
MIVIDAHCHLEAADYPDVDEVLERAKAAGLVHAVIIGQLQKPGDFGRAVALAAAHPGLLTPTLGIHPHDAQAATPADFEFLEAACAEPEIAAVGEAGLDYYYDRSPRPVQAEAFRRQCRLAVRLGKPLVVHVRDAHDDCLSVLREERVGSGVIHCFTGDSAAAEGYLALGFHLSISGVVTYKKSEALQAAVRQVPLERLLVETDCPYLAPGPHRGKRNEPGFVALTAAKVAELKGLDPEALALSAARNTVALFGLPVRLP